MKRSRARWLLILGVTSAWLRSEAPAQTEEPGKEPAVNATPDYSKLDLRGNGHTQDSFSLAVQCAARLFGKNVDYETVYSLSGNAFAPAINKGEDCTAWWHVQGWQADKAMDTVASGLGLRVERVEIPPHELSPEDSEEEIERKALLARKKCAAVVRESMGKGAVVLTGGGWRVRAEEGFAPWCWWGIVTKAGQDGDIRGACLGADPGRASGFRDRPLDYLGSCWAVSPGEPAPDADGLDATVLRQAVARIRGTGPYAATEKSVYGLVPRLRSSAPDFGELKSCILVL